MRASRGGSAPSRKLIDSTSNLTGGRFLRQLALLVGDQIGAGAVFLVAHQLVELHRFAGGQQSGLHLFGGQAGFLGQFLGGRFAAQFLGQAFAHATQPPPALSLVDGQADGAPAVSRRPCDGLRIHQVASVLRRTPRDGSKRSISFHQTQVAFLDQVGQGEPRP